MEAVVTTGTINRAKLQSNRHHQQTNIQFFTGRMSFLSPNRQCQSTEGKYHIPQWYLSLQLLLISCTWSYVLMSQVYHVSV